MRTVYVEWCWGHHAGHIQLVVFASYQYFFTYVSAVHENCVTVYEFCVGVIMLDTFSWLYWRDGVREDNSHGTLIHITKKVRASGPADHHTAGCW